METEKPFQWTNVRNQYIATITANLIMLGHGLVMGWVAPAILKLSSNDTPLITGPLNTEQISWIGSINCIGALFGSFSFGYFTSFMGCKRAILTLAIPAIAFWLLIHFGDTYYHLLFGRWLVGFTAGGMQSTIMLFISEVANDNVRGRLGSFMLFMRNIGTLLSFILGATLEYEQIPCICICVPIIFALAFAILPNTPRFHLRNGHIQNAEKALKFYKGYKGSTSEEDEALYKELERLKLIAREQKEETKLGISDICERAALKGIGIGIALSIFSQMTACFTIVSYAVTIFDKAGTSFNPYLSSIMLGLALISGSLTTTYLADKLGRKLLNTISLAGSAFGLLAMSLFQFLYLNGHDLSMFAFVPVVCLSFVTFISSAGILPLTVICSVEYLPTKVRTFGMSIVAFTLSAAAFVSAKMFPTLLDAVGLHGCMLIHGIGCVGATIFVFFVLEETNGKSLDEIGKCNQKPADVVAAKA